jgi:hypothetical protein
VRPFEDDFSSAATPPSSINTVKCPKADDGNPEIVEIEHLGAEKNRPLSGQASPDLISSPVRCSATSPKSETVETSLDIPLGDEKGCTIGGGGRDGAAGHISMELEERKLEDQDSDYESMASDSSLRRDGQVLCPASGRLLLSDESSDLREDSDSGLREDGGEASTGREEENDGVLALREEDLASSSVDDTGEPGGSHQQLDRPDDHVVTTENNIMSGVDGTEEKCKLSGKVAGPTCSPDSVLFREPGPEPTSREKLKYLRYFRLVTHSRKNGENGATYEMFRS